MKKLQATPKVSRTQRTRLRDYFSIPSTGAGSRLREDVYKELRNRYNVELQQVQGFQRYEKTPKRIAEKRSEKIKTARSRQILRRAIFRIRENNRYLHTVNFDAWRLDNALDTNGRPRRNARGQFIQEWKKMERIKSVQFVSKQRHPLLQSFNINWNGAVFDKNTLPTINASDFIQDNFLNRDRVDDAVSRFFDLPDVLTSITVDGSDDKVFVIKSVDILKVPKEDAKLADMRMYREVIQSATPEFRGFKDTGNFNCVPETIKYHLERKGRKNKQYTLEEIIRLLNGDEPEYRWQSGWTCYDLIRALDTLRVAYKLVDVENKVFLQDTKSDKRDRNIPVFVGQVWNNHLYYCEDDDYIKSLASKEVAKLSGKALINRKKKAFEGEVLPVEDLKDHFLKQFQIDKTFRRVQLYNNRIVAYESDNGWLYANKDVDLVRESCKTTSLPFENQSLTILGKSIFDKHYPAHRQSHFNVNVFSELSVNAGIVECFGDATGENQLSADINKCRTACFLDNKLGDYPVYGINCDIQEYSGGELKFGQHYVITKNRLPMRGDGWYSNDFLEYCRGKGIPFEVKYSLEANDRLPADYGVKITEELMKASPDKYKLLVNTMIGYFGKTVNKSSQGYLETDFRYACQKFWNSDVVGTIYNLDDAVGISNRKRLRIDKFKCVDIGEMYYGENDEKIYMVQETIAKKMFVNDVPIYNKILENEWIRCYELREKLGGRLIKIKTDNVVVENGNQIEYSQDIIGGYKDETAKDTWIPLLTKHFPPELRAPKSIETKLVWERVKVEMGDADNYFEKLRKKLPNGSFCLTGLAGYGKSECVKGCDWYNDETTLKVAFTNKATESMSGETICQAFGIDFRTGQATQSKISKCKDIKRIVNDECFMTPSYCMELFDFIKSNYTEIDFVFVGDPEQTRPVGEEHINWMNTSVFHKLCGGVIVELVENKRNDLSIEYHQIINGDPFDVNAFGKHRSSKINICRTNQRRKEINAVFMKKTGTFIEYNANTHNPKGQNVYLTKGTPVMSVINDKILGLVNSKMWVIDSIGEISGSFPECLEVLEPQIKIGDNSFGYDFFMKNFVVAYAYTNHKVQGITINEPFCIHEWDLMSSREKYTAFSRTTRREHVRIYLQ
jgi:hypothetical protein